jgi:hypothetical protein
MADIIYCLFSLSRRDPRFANETLAGVKKWLDKEKRAEEPYLFHAVKPRKVTKGSKLLFSFEAKVFGKAIAKSDVEDIPVRQQEAWRREGKYVYKYSIVFDSTSIGLLRVEVTKKEIEEVLEIDCDRPFRYLTKAQYNKILEMGGLPLEL